MEWKFISPDQLEHLDGHKITLKEGTWKEPAEIQPVFEGSPAALEVSRLIREGLAFAVESHRQVAKPKPVIPRYQGAPRPTLSLKK